MLNIPAQIKDILKYIHKNAWTIVFLIVGGYFVYDSCKFCDCSIVVNYILQYAKSHSHAQISNLILFFINLCTVIDPLIHKYRTNKSYKEATNPDRVAVLTPDMKRVRLAQQQQTIQRSLAAAEERKQTMKEERERKRVKSPEEERWDKLGGEGNRLGDTESSDVDGSLRRRR